MRRSRIVAALAIGPLALVLAGLVAHAPAMRWLEREPIVVVTGEVGTAHTVGGAPTTVHGAQIVAPGSEAAGYADAPAGAQIVVVDVTIAQSDLGSSSCVLELEATVGGSHGTWSYDTGSSDVTSCYSEEEALSGSVGFVVPAGPIEDARFLVGGETIWLGVPLTL
jgi:hypothetical protein